MTQSAPRCAALLGASILALVCVSPCQQQPASDQIRLVYADFDPLVDPPRVPPALRADGSGRLWIVQLAGGTTDAARDAIAGAGGELHGYLPDHAYVVRADAGQAVTMRDLADVRWVGRYEPAYRLEPFLLDARSVTRSMISWNSARSRSASNDRDSSNTARASPSSAARTDGWVQTVLLDLSLRR